MANIQYQRTIKSPYVKNIGPVDSSHVLAEIKRKGLRVVDVADQIGMTKSGMYAAMRNDTLQASKLIALCEILGISLEQAVYGRVKSKSEGYIEDRIALLEEKMLKVETHLNLHEKECDDNDTD